MTALAASELSDIRDLAREEAREELARRRLLDFGRYVYPGFQDPPHIRLLADLLEQVERGTLRRLMVNIPVRHGKSTLCSQIFPSWVIGRHPTWDVINASHSEDLATRNGRASKRIVEDPTWPFAEVRLSRDSTSAQRWNTEAGGGVYSIGVGGSVTGRGANILNIDDALHDGQSQAEMDKSFAWYSEVALPRLEPGGAVIVVGARFADQDLCGQILESPDGPNWRVVRIPVLAEPNDVLGREPGAPLWPERMSLDEIEMRKVSMASRAFEAQFMQDPQPRGGKLYNINWLGERFETLPQGLRVAETADELARQRLFGEAPRKRSLIVVQSIDSAWKDGPSSDWSVIATIATDLVDFYIVDIWRQRVQYPDLRRAVLAQYEKYRPRIIYCEEAQSGYAIVQELKRSTPIPILGVRPSESKEARAEAVLPLWESLRVKLRANAPWVDDFVSEFSRFPGGRFDDTVDAVNLGLSQLWQVAKEYHTRRQHQPTRVLWKER